MAQAYPQQPAAPVCPHTLSEVWALFLQERSIALCPTSLTSDYQQVSKWLARCPIQDFAEGRQILIWLLQQQPTLSARRVCMYVRSMYRWACAEDVGLIHGNPVANFRMPKAPQKNGEITVIPRQEIALVLSALSAKLSYKSVDWSLFAEFMLQTAMRTGEVRAAKCRSWALFSLSEGE